MKKSTKIGLFFGSFNPIHVGHLIIANYMVSSSDLKEVWFVVSPHNPHKEKKTLLADYHRLAIVNEAVADNLKLKASNIEFNLPQPSYTINTLVYLEEKHPKKQFVLLMGEDNLRSFQKWKNHEEILEQCELYVYPRIATTPIKETELFQHPKVKLFDVPTMNLSASFIRNAIKNKQDTKYMLTPPVDKYIKEMNFYK